MSEQASVSLLINGQVQGVFFRLKTKEEADKLGLTGWVKNNVNGSVEVLAEGEKGKLDELIDWCHDGSDASKVANVAVKWQPYNGEFNGFKII